MSFADPKYFYLSIFIILMCLLATYSVWRGRRLLSQFGTMSKVKSLSVRYSKWLRLASFSSAMLALLFLVLMIARPQRGLDEATDTDQGIEIVVMADVSNSMQAADVSPSRLESAKFLLDNIIDNMTGDRVALGIFAGEAYLQLPITSDRFAAKAIVAKLSPSMISMQGTHIAAALNMANRSFSENDDADKAIILITDGENHEGDIEAAAEAVKSAGRKLFVLGIGTSEGSTIPTQGGPLVDEDGNVVVTRLDENLCRQIAQSAGGKYIHVDNTFSAQSELESELRQLKKSSRKTKYLTYDERFQTFGFMALALFVIASFIPEYFRRKGKMRSAVRTLALMFVLSSGVSPLYSQTASWRALHGANRQFDKGNYAEAQSRYEKILSKNPTNSRALFNLANSCLAQGDADRAVQLYAAAAQVEQDPTVKSRAFHNLGVISQTAALKADEATRQKLLREAIDHYKNALRQNPADDGARYNLELCKKQLKGNDKDKDDNQQKQQQKPQQQPQPQQPRQQEFQPQQTRQDMATQQLLNLTRQSEQRTRDKINAAKPRSRSREKNW